MHRLLKTLFVQMLALSFANLAEAGIDVTSIASSSGESYALGSGCNGPVNAIAEAPDGSVFLGGDFSLCGGISVNNIARFNPATQEWSILGDASGNGSYAQVEAMAFHEGALYVSARTFMPGSPLQVSAHVGRWQDGEWSGLTFSGYEVGYIRVLVSRPEGLYIAGEIFPKAASLNHGEILLWDGTVARPFASGANVGGGLITALAWYGGEMYIGGSLNMPIQGHAQGRIGRIARWNGQNWTVVGSQGGGALSGTPYTWTTALAVHEGALYLGGEFSEVDSGSASPVAASNIARWDGSNWAALGAGTDGRVLAMQSSPQGLWVGGRFKMAGVVDGRGLAGWTSQGWNSLTTYPLASSGTEVRTFAPSLNGMLVGGAFGWASSGEAQPLVLNHVAIVSAASWSPLGEPAGFGANGLVRVFAEHAGELYAGGDFTSIGGVSANRLARHDGIRWHPLGTASGNGVNALVRSFASFEGVLYIGGHFDRGVFDASEMELGRLAVWDGERIRSPDNAIRLDGPVHALLVDGDSLYVGGRFDVVEENGIQRSISNIARLRSGAWHSLGGEVFNRMYGLVYALERDLDGIYVGGRLQGVRLTEDEFMEARGVLRWDGSSWHRVSRPGSLGLGNPVLLPEVHDLEMRPDGLYAAGMFDSADAGSSNPIRTQNVARWTGSEWQPLGGEGQGPLGYVFTLHWKGPSLVVGGQFRMLRVAANQDVQSPSLAVFESGRWQASAARIGSKQNSEFVYALLSDSTGLHVGGRFGSAGNQPASHITRIELPLFVSGFEAYEAVGR